jgi:hypothetical protein
MSAVSHFSISLERDPQKVDKKKQRRRNGSPFSRLGRLELSSSLAGGSVIPFVFGEQQLAARRYLEDTGNS